MGESNCSAGCCAPKPPEKKEVCESGCCSTSAGSKDMRIEHNLKMKDVHVTEQAPGYECCTPAEKPAKEDKCCSGGAGDCGGGSQDVVVATKDDCCKPKTRETASLAKPVIEPTQGSKDDCCVSDDQPVVTQGCQSGCCKPLNERTTVANDNCCGSNEQPAVSQGCQSGCCKPEKGGTASLSKPLNEPNQIAKDDCCASEEQPVVSQSCESGCCKPPAKETAPLAKPLEQEDCKDDCCAPTPANTGMAVSCQDACCAGNDSDLFKSEPAPACCEGKTSPCCDESCIDRLALRECDETCHKNGGHANDNCVDKSTGSESKGACGYHSKTMREKYAERLAAIGCICRALIALGQESCCATPETRSRGKRPVVKRSSSRKGQQVTRTGNSCTTSGCCTDKSASSPVVKNRAPRKLDSRSSLNKGCQSACCDKSGDSCSIRSVKRDDKCSGDDCCTGKSLQQTTRMTEAPKATPGADVEGGLAGTEHVVLSVTGMTCTGCETKLSRILATLPHISNLKASLVMSRAEFNLDSSIASVADIIRYIERTTDFRCEKLTTEGTSIDVIPQGDVIHFLQEPCPLGILEMRKARKVEKNTVRIEFDPKIIGARDIVERTFKSPVQLAPLRGDPGLAAGRKHVKDMGRMTLLSTVLAVPVLVLAWAPIQKRPIIYGAVSLALATIIQVAIAGPFYPAALKSLVFSNMIEMDLLIVLSTSAAYIFSVVSYGYLATGKPLSSGEFFETSTLLVTLIMVGRYVSALARQQAVESISIRSLQASTALLVEKNKASEREIDSRLLQYGDVFKVMPESRVPTDGTVLSGSSEMDESMLTGESTPVEKQAGATVIAGSINGSGTLLVRLTRLPNENTISTIAGMVDHAKLSKPKIQDLADRVASYFVPGVVSLTIITFIVWIAVGVAKRKQSGSEAAVMAITYAITVLIVSCPCAIGLAVPMVVVIATGVASQRGVIFKSANAIEIAHKTTHVVFDKTGTLTEGKLSVVTEKYLTDDGDKLKSIVLGLVANIKHPVSVAMARHLQSNEVRPLDVDNVKSLPGKGVEGTTAQGHVQAGNAIWLGFEFHPAIQDVNSHGYTAFCVSIDSELVAVFGLSDSIRDDALSVVNTLRQRGVSISILSGDSHGAVATVARQLAIPEDNVKARCTPADKASYIRDLQVKPRSVGTSGTSPPIVVFVGDGTNDAVALAQANIGVHMNGGTDVAQSAADVTLMRPSLAGIITMVDVSRAAVRRIKFNFAWSFVYNLFAVLLAAGAFATVGNGDVVRIPPQYAGLGELVSVLPVILVAVLLRWARF